LFHGSIRIDFALGNVIPVQHGQYALPYRSNLC
jgi:hypothetical protein